jgi:DNA-binding NarL/FixJ family response regulator
MEVVIDSADADEILAALPALRSRAGPVVVLISIGLGGDHGAFWLMRSVRERFPSMTVVACGANADGLNVSRALFFGADAFLDKSADPREFLEALSSAARRELVLAGVRQDWLGSIAAGLEQYGAPSKILTTREIQVLAVAAEGLTARQIGTRLGVRERTVTTHLGKIYRKLGASGRLSAVSSATRYGLLSPPSAE